MSATMNGYASRFRLMTVDRDTWEDGEEIDGLFGGSVTKDAESDLVESGSFEVDGYRYGVCYVRLYAEGTGVDGPWRHPIATMVATTPSRQIDGTLSTSRLECYSVLKPAYDRLLMPGWHFPAGGDPIAGASELLAACLNCPVEPASSGIRTAGQVTAERGETALSMANVLLEGTGYALCISPMGKVSVEPLPSIPTAQLDAEANDILMPTITDTNDLFDVPNVIMAVNGDDYSVARNEDPSSETSIQSVGWEKWRSETASDGSLFGQAYAKLEEYSAVSRTVSYTREFEPTIRVNDVVRIMLPAQEVVGDFRITAQQYDIGYGITVQENATSVFSAWRR